MSTGKRRGGLRAPLFFLAATILSSSAEFAVAETVDVSALETCASLKTSKLKLGCFEAIIQIGKPVDERASEIAVVPVAEKEAAATELEPEIEISVVRAVPKDDSVDSLAPPEDDFGHEQLVVPDRDTRKEIVIATIVDVTRGYDRSLTFHLANGQVWRQIEPRHFQYPKQTDFEASISQGMMGEYRLRIGEKGRMIRIRRVQ